MNDFSIVTFYNSINYGAVLQAFALQTFIDSLGYSVAMYKVKEEPSTKPSIEGYVKKISRFIHRHQFGEKNARFAEFISSRINVSSGIDSKVFLAGSDQVWNPKKYDPDFYLKFVPEGSIRASYAASIGLNAIPEEYVQIFQENIKNIQYFSVRENKAKEIIEAFVDADILVHIDPTLLLDGEQWSQYESPVPYLPEKYILLYILHVPQNLNALIDWLRAETGYKAVLIDDRGYLKRIIHNDVTLWDVGPEQFLYLVNHASQVITTSFHGTAFSIIFHKEFYSIIHSASPSRVSNLLDMCGLKGITDYQKLFKRIIQSYDHVKDILDQERKRSEKYLEKLIKE